MPTTLWAYEESGSYLGWTPDFSTDDDNPFLPVQGSNGQTAIVDTLAGTQAIQLDGGDGPLSWWSAPLDRGVTISGAISFDIAGSESGMSANAGLRAVIDRCSSDGTFISNVIDSSQGVELPTTWTTQSWSATPTSTTMAAGDRLRYRVYVVNVGVMGAGFTVQVSTSDRNDSYINRVTFTETLVFPILGGSVTETSYAKSGTGVQEVIDAFMPWYFPLNGTDYYNTARCEGTIYPGFEFVPITSGAVSSLYTTLGRNSTLPTDNVYFEIRSGGLSGSVIATSDQIAASGLSGTYSWRTITFSTAVDLVEGQTYGLVMRRTGANSTTNYATLAMVHYNSSWFDSSPAKVKKWDGAAWVDYTAYENDPRFILYRVPTIQVTPATATITSAAQSATATAPPIVAPAAASLVTSAQSPTITGGNQAPVAVATVTPDPATITDVLTLTGSDSTDDVGIVTFLWEKLVGPPGTIANPNAADTTFTPDA